MQANAAVLCPTPKADGPVDPKAFKRTTTYPHRSGGATPPAADTKCRFANAYVTGVSLSAAGPNRQALWTPPDPTMPSSAPVADGPSLPPPYYGMIIPETMSRVAGQFKFWLRYQYVGKYNGTDWECRGSYSYADTGVPCWGDNRSGPVAWCILAEPAGQVPPALTQPPDPTRVPAIQAKLAEMQHTTDGGVMGTSPADRTRQFVNLPSCFWIDGAPPPTAFEVSIDAPPNSDGRGLTYVYRVNVGLETVHWDYGDGTSWDGDAGAPFDASGTCTNPHTYTRISAIGNPVAGPCPAAYPHPSADDGCYQVKASETYSVSVTAYWNDNGPRPQTQDMGAQAPFTVTPRDDTLVRVLQIEGIPISR